MDFSKCIPQSSEYDLNGELLHLLRELEVSLSLSFDSFKELKINSAYRSPEYEVRQGRSGLSAHCLGKAVDIHCTDNRLRYQILNFAIKKGINRIGIYKTFIHLDIASYKDDKGQNTIWFD